MKNLREYTTTRKNSRIKIVLITRATKNRFSYIPSERILMTIKMLDSTGSLKIVLDRTMNKETPFRM